MVRMMSEGWVKPRRSATVEMTTLCFWLVKGMTCCTTKLTSIPNSLNSPQQLVNIGHTEQPHQGDVGVEVSLPGSL